MPRGFAAATDGVDGHGFPPENVPDSAAFPTERVKKNAQKNVHIFCAISLTTAAQNATLSVVNSLQVSP